MYEFFFAIFHNSLSLVFCGNFFAYSMMMVLLYCSFGDKLNATLWIASYLWLNVTRGSVGDVCMFCSLVAASVVLGMSEQLVRIVFLISSSDAAAGNSESMCNIKGAMLWQIGSQNGLLLKLAAASIWLSHMMHSALLVPSKILMFFISRLLTSLFLLSVMCARICVNASVMLVDGAGDAPLYWGFGTVLFLGIWFSNRFSE